ncbi:helix-turn-helix domain-containing protein [uncultured Mitsuokella sp.]|uniref:helix-turn-helix domain-containing protein n=1 Tax=uncultured Mitsuokella sp. TaxID=453120 RepID=UPI0025F8AA71|nr:helix-turn-helix transcriptional regulator [uncultured Mitsuokella sp.]
MKFGDRIRYARECLDISRNDLAKKLQLSYFTLSKYETSEREPDFQTLLRIAQALHVTTDFLLGNDTGQTNLALSEAEQSFLLQYRVLSPQAKDRIRNQLNFEFIQQQQK